MAIRMTRSVLAEVCRRFNANPDAAPTAALVKVLPFVEPFDPRTAQAMRATIGERAR